ncbi:MAG: hypothetical protein GXO36_01040 [Chloroflexi bacterium]|nr:hypothetical protein [Chloroflexota bacterium]
MNKHFPLSLPQFGTISVFSFAILAYMFLGCSSMLRMREVFEGSDAWVRELTRGMTITPEYPPNRVVTAGEPWEFVLRITNQGPHEPHLHLIWVEVVDPEEPVAWSCQILDAEVEKVKKGETYYLFFLRPQKLAQGSTVETHLQCTLMQPGTYEILWGAELEESGISFFTDIVTLQVR